jgi:hypothetical protein
VGWRASRRRGAEGCLGARGVQDTRSARLMSATPRSWCWWRWRAPGVKSTDGMIRPASESPTLNRRIIRGSSYSDTDRRAWFPADVKTIFPSGWRTHNVGECPTCLGRASPRGSTGQALKVVGKSRCRAGLFGSEDLPEQAGVVEFVSDLVSSHPQAPERGSRIVGEENGVSSHWLVTDWGRSSIG